MRNFGALFFVVSSLAEALTLSNAYWGFEIDPATLAVRAKLAGGLVKVVSAAGAAHAVRDLEQQPDQATWILDDGTRVGAKLSGEVLTVRFSRTVPGRISWPRMPSGARALMLPIGEGYYIGANDAVWRKALERDYDGIDTTQDLSLPVLGLDWGEHVLSVLFANPFNNSLRFPNDGSGIGVEATHTFTSLDPTRAFEVQFRLAGKDRLAPAKHYRQWLTDQGRFVPLKLKLAVASDGERLIGASHIYVWGSRMIVPGDVVDWDRLRQAIPVGWIKPLEARQALNAKDLGHNRYVQKILLEAVEAALEAAVPGQSASNFRERKALASRTLGVALISPERWGDASIKIIEELQQAGLKKVWMGLPQWEAGFANPEVIAAAREAGYLIGPYDSYDTALPEGNDNPGWSSAQLGQRAFLDCGIVLEDGRRKTGFQGKGVYTNPACVSGLMHNRVTRIEAASHYNSWFLDVDGSGMVFDDYDGGKPTSQAQDAENRNAAMDWIGRTFSVVVGSEDGHAVVNRAISFAHGIETKGFGWRDPDMRKNKTSPYYLGAWYPPEEPQFFFKQVLVKPEFLTLYFDPAKRLPLFQAAFHDSVVTTHHWTLDSLKFREPRATTELLEQLYNVPPLVNISLESAKVRLPYLKRLDSFFRPLHERLYDQPLTGFEWLDQSGLVQETRFADGTRIIANFASTPFTHENYRMAARSALAILPDGHTLEYKSQ